jgi:long-chain acyl-CoA synthetase
VATQRNTEPGMAAYDERPWLSSYPAEVPHDYDFPDVPLTRFLDDAADSFPTSLAIAFLGTTMTYAQLRADVDRFAGALDALGVTKGDRVALVLPNCPQNVIAFYAILRLGAVVVQHNPLYTPHEMGHQLADCGAKIVITLDRAYATVLEAQPETAVEHIVVTSIIDYLPRRQQLLLKLPISKAKTKRAEISAVVPKGVARFTDLLARSPGPAKQADLDPSTDLALLQYTGGTTGLSKGAMLTHANLVANAYQCRLWFTGAKAGQESTLAVLPLFHAYGLTLCLGLTVLLAGNLILLPRFDLELTFEAIDKWQPTLFPGVPPIYKAMVDSPDVGKHNLRSIKECVSGAMKLPVEVAASFEQITGGRLVEGYGMTEASPVTHANPLTGTRRSGMIGIPIPGTLARVVDQEDPAVPMPIGEPGELVIRGPQVMAGYWNAPENDESADTFTQDGYLRTGDIAVMDADGWFNVVDRKKELIIAGGFNIYPSEIEEVLYTMVGIADVVVVGVPDPYRGETVKAYIVLQPGATLTEVEVKAYCSERLTAYKVPKLVEFRDTLPRTMVGKVLRRVLVAEEREKQAAAATTAARESDGG